MHAKLLKLAWFDKAIAKIKGAVFGTECTTTTTTTNKFI